MRKNTFSRCLVLAALVWLSLMLIPGFQALAADPAAGCPDGGKIVPQVAPEVELVSVVCAFKPYEGVNSLHYTLTLKNVSDKPKRFRVNIFLDSGKAVGGYIPVNVKDGLVEPGKEAGFTYPAVGQGEPVKETVIIVKTAE